MWQEATPRVLTAAEYANAVRSASDPRSFSDLELALVDPRESEGRRSGPVPEGPHHFLGSGIVYGASLSPLLEDDALASTASAGPLSGGMHRPPLPLVLPGPGRSRPGIGARLVVQVRPLWLVVGGWWFR